MRKVQNAQRSAVHGFVITVIGLLFLTASSMLAAPQPRVTVQKAAEPVRNEYLIMLNVPADDVPKVAKELTQKYGGEVLAVWQHAVKGFWLKAEPEVVRHMVQDRRIRSCEENALGHDSADSQLTKLNLDLDGSRITPTPTGSYPSFGNPDHPLWHLNRISHRQRQDDLEHPDYPYGSDGTGVSIYIIDSGVLRWHQEFYANPGPGSPALTQASIIKDATDKVDHSPRIRTNAAANITDGRKAHTYLVEGSLGKDPINNGYPIAPVGVCTAPTTYNFTPPPNVDFNYLGQTHGTACASVAAGRNVGVAKGATIVPVRVFNCSNSDSLGAVITGLEWTL
ncbi:MAG: S8 family serine peptidase, partial [Acidobacteriota bacterium]